MNLNNLVSWWQHLPGRIDPVLVTIGPLQIRYYGLMYVVALAIGYWLVRYRVRREDRYRSLAGIDLQELAIWLIIGVMVGGRLGYVLFYDLAYYLRHPLEIILPFHFDDGIVFTGLAGMSYHGGLIGAILAGSLFGRKKAISFLILADLVAPVVPLGYTFGRIGNFINGELYGRITDVPWGMYFPLAPDPRLRHPSQLYEALFEGIFLFTLLWSIRKRPLPRGAMLPLYLVGYGAVRFVIEFFRAPDAWIGFEVGRLTRGQLLCLGMMVVGVLLLLHLSFTSKAGKKS